MSYVSTAGSDEVRLAEALRLGLAEDGGLFMPQRLEPLPSTFFDALPGMSLSTLALRLFELDGSNSNRIGGLTATAAFTRESATPA